MLNILLIEDNPGDIRLIKEMFSDIEDFSVELQAEETLKSGIRKAETWEEIDLILLDLGLPKSSGLETLNTLLSEIADLPVVILTGLKDKELAIEAVRMGAQDYLVKGAINSDVLEKVIRYSIERARVEKRIERFNSLLKAIREVNQVIVQGGRLKDIMRRACESLVETRSYLGCTVSLLNKVSGTIIPVAEAGGYGFAQDWEITPEGDGNAPECVKNVMKSGDIEIISTENCKDCKFEHEEEPHQSITVPMEIEGKLIGFLHAGFKGGLEVSNEEMKLLDDVASDLAFAREKILAEKAMEESEKRFRRAVLDSPYPMMLHADDGEVINLNDAWVEITGYTPEDIPTISDWIEKAYGMGKEMVREDIDRLYEIEERVEEGEYEIRTADDKRRIWDFSSSPLGELPDGRRLVLSVAHDITDRKKMEEKQKRLLHDMEERVKELKCIHKVTESISRRNTMEEVFQDVTSFIPPGWHYPEITRGKVVFDGEEFVSEPFEETEWKQSADIVVDGEIRGVVEVYYLEERPTLDEGPFLQEERNLIDIIAKSISEYIERKRVEEERKNYIQELKFLNETAIRISHMSDIDEMCRFLGGSIHSVNEETYVIISLYDPESGGVRIRSMHGFGRILSKVIEIFGRDPRNLTFHPEDMKDFQDYYLSGKLERVPEGLYTLGERKFPKNLTEAVEKMLGIGDVYTAGFALEDKPIGGIIILTPPGKKIQNRSAIETLASHFSVTVQRLQSKRALEESEEKYRALVENQGVGIVFVDEDEELTYANPAAEKIFNLESGNLVGKNLLDFLEPDQKEMVLRETGIRKEGEKSTYKMEINRPDGEKRLIVVTATPRFDDEGNYRGAYTVFRDITKRREAEAALEESEKKYRTMVESSHDAILIYKDNEFLFTNEQFEDLTGYREEELYGNEDIFEFIHPEDRERVRDYFRGRKINEGISGSFEARIETKNGRILWGHFSISAISYEGKDAFFVSIRDFTSEKEREEELQKIDKLESLGILAGGIAHDFNNLLTGIIGNISLARSESEGRLNEMLRDVEIASRRAQDLTKRLLTFSKGEEPVTERTKIREIIKDSSEFILSGSNVKCVYNFPDNLWEVEVDAGQISQVVNNLLLNADQAMPEGGEVKISAENIVLEKENAISLEPGNYVRVRIEDEGIGIPESHLDKIFDPYFSTKSKGSGLGLSSVYSIIQKHDGYINVVSEVEKGTTFSIYLPAVIEAEEVGGEVPEKEVSTGEVGGRILLMDDNEMVGRVVDRMLGENNYRVEVCRNGEETIKKYRESFKSSEPYDLVILDLTVPGGMGGKETIKRLRDIDPEVKAVVSSGYSSDSIMSNYERYGFIDFIEKPYDTEKLRETINKILK